MKKLLLVLMVFGLTFGFFGCSKDDGNGDSPVEKPVVKSPVDDLAGRLPDEVIGFIASSGGASLEEGFETSLVGQLCNDPEVESFYKEIKGAISLMIDKEMGDGEEKGIFDKVVTLLEQASHRPFVIGVAGKDVQSNLRPVFGFLMIDAGEQKADIAKAIESLESLDKDGEIVDVTVGEYTMHGPKDNEEVPGYWGWVGKYFVFAINDGSGLALKNLVAGGQTAYTAKLDKVRGNGDAMAAYVDCQKAGALVKKLGSLMRATNEMGMIEKALNELGLGSTETIISRLGFSGPDMVAESFIELPGEKKGLISCIKPVDPAMMDLVDSRAVGAHVCNVDIGGVYDVILNTVKVVAGDEVHKMVQGQVGNVETQVGVEIRNGLLESLGGPAVMYAMPMGVDGMMAGGIVIIADLKDAKLFEDTMNGLGAFAQKMAEGMFTPSTVEKDGRTMHYWTVAPLSMAQILPTWTIADGKLVFASSSQMCNIAVAQVVSGDKGKTSIRSTAAYKQVAGKLPKNLTALSYNDTKTTMKQVRTLLQQFWPMGASMIGREMGMQLPVKIPDAEGVINNMTPMISYSWIDEAGFHSRSQGPMLVESAAVLGGGAMGAAILMPALSKSKMIAKQIQCASQLNGIGKACYMYMGDFKGKMPPNLEVLVELMDIHPKMFVCPGSGDKVGQNSYVYRGVDLNDSSRANMVVAYDKKGNHSDGTRNVLFMDSHVKKYAAEQFVEVMNKDNELRRKAGLKEKPFE